MPEGPSIFLAKEEMEIFKGMKVLSVSGNASFDKDRMVSKKLLEVKTWGKHLLLCFKGFSVRIHLLLFGKYLINTQKQSIPRLSLNFKKGQLNFYACSIKLLDQPLDKIYDWNADVLSPGWDAKAAKKKLRGRPELLVTDALLDQNIFSGVGNIIKNEVLYRICVHPKSQVGNLPLKKLNQLVKEARNYSFDFLNWKREVTLKKHWLVHTKKTCSRDGSKIYKEYLGKTKRRTFFCNQCQVKYY